MSKQYRIAAVSCLALVATLLGGCAAPVVKTYGMDDHFSSSEIMSGSTATADQCARTVNAVWVDVGAYHECVVYFPSSAFAAGAPIDRAIVFMEGDRLDGKQMAEAQYEKSSPRVLTRAAEREQQRAGLPYLILGRPGTDGSSGSQRVRRTHYETLVVNAALDQIKRKYQIQQLGIIGQSGGGGLVGALISERQDVLCGVASSGVTAVKYRIQEKGWTADITGIGTSEVWDPVDQLPRARPMPGFRLFATSDKLDGDVPFDSQQYFIQKAQEAGLPAVQIVVHASGSVHHQTFPIGNKVMADCMKGVPTETIVARYTGHYVDQKEEAKAFPPTQAKAGTSSTAE
ncbi:hypothetical protein [Silvimonas amylolytica]|uniref:Alpha/beta hydrolase family protein n=1 Tax=Silvimonas amylolytica TaxID=449663 RepID=A0ABQ2PP56_9NEIS|nr:hypothetical protein [Silvimonas amylolytica]GGP27098.1 hypothetical protein GCM10010971_29170 [Silvimonas amylolytica]